MNSNNSIHTIVFWEVQSRLSIRDLKMVEQVSHSSYVLCQAAYVYKTKSHELMLSLYSMLKHMDYCQYYAYDRKTSVYHVGLSVGCGNISKRVALHIHISGDLLRELNRIGVTI